MAKGRPAPVRIKNRRARHEYHILEQHEAGLVLTGSEVKSLRQGKASIAEGFVKERNGELFLHNVHIAEYANAGYATHEPTRPRKILLHRRDINKLVEKLNEAGLTLIPLALYFRNGYAKVEIGLARGKKLYDKREAMKKREAEREIQRQLRGKQTR